MAPCVVRRLTKARQRGLIPLAFFPSRFALKSAVTAGHGYSILHGAAHNARTYSVQLRDLWDWHLINSCYEQAVKQCVLLWALRLRRVASNLI